MLGRVPVARRNILADRRRLVVAVVGIGVALGLIFLLQGLWRGFQVQVSAYQDRVGVDLFVGQPGVHNFLGEVSVIPADTAERIRVIPGIDEAAPITARSVILDLHGTKQFTFLIANERAALGGPWQLAEGREVVAEDEVVLDRTLAEQHGIGLGGRLEVLGRSLRVVGLSEQTRSWMSSFVFVSPATAQRLLGTEGTASYVLVRTPDAAAASARIEQRTGLKAIPAGELAENDRALLTGIMGAPLNLMVVVAFIAGTLIVALTVYSAIVERIGEYGIAKAMGAHRARLFGLVFGQTLVLAGLGALIGYGVYAGASRLVMLLRPQFWTQLTPASVAFVLVAAVLMAVLAAVIPTYRVIRLDPASVYRG